MRDGAPTAETSPDSWSRPDRVLIRLAGETEARRGLWAAALLVALIAELTAFLVAATWTTEAMGRFTNLVEANPFAPGRADVFYVHRHRILGPAIAWVLGLRGVWAALVPIAANVPLLAIVYRFVRTRCSLTTAVLGTMLMATTHLTMTSRTLLGYQDSLVFLLAMVAFISPRIWVAGPALFLAMYGDQRAMMMVPFIMAWRYLEDPDPGGRLLRNLRLGLQLAVVVVAWVGSAWLLSIYWGQSAETGQALKDFLVGRWVQARLGAVHLSVFMAFKAGWLLLLAGIWVCLYQRAWWPALLIGSSAALICAMGLLVGDLSRAAAHCFPALLIGLVLYSKCDRPGSEQLVRVCLLLNLITPFYQGMAQGLWIYSRPFPAELVLQLLGR